MLYHQYEMQRLALTPMRLIATNALRVLDAFEADEEVGVTELARRLHLHKNNVFRLLATLEDKGWVEQSEDSERYRLGDVWGGPWLRAAPHPRARS